ncbi:hypothetical protein MMC15_008205, partial [Xylographa vitiligo]|nr:hypothetical protein [Xylographa vitiligo]
MDKFFAQHLSPSSSSASSNPQTQSSNIAEPYASEEPKTLPKGVVLGKDGKPCRSCTSASEWRRMMRSATAPSTPPSSSPTTTRAPLPASASTTHPSPPTADDDDDPPTRSDCPPDVAQLGNHTWTLLHSISASYPARASLAQQSEMTQFLGLFAKLYPCWVCAEDFRAWMARAGNEPRVEGRAGLGRWMCEAHNEVNRKLGKEVFD